MPIDEQKEQDFNEWLESIRFVDEQGDLLLVELTPDESEDPENDRTEEVEFAQAGEEEEEEEE